jgi:hypothetical protein
MAGESMKASRLKLSLALIGWGVMTSAANAAVNFTSVPFDIVAPLLPPPAAGETLVTDFDTAILGQPLIAPGYNWTSVGGELHNPPLVYGIAAPVPLDESQYFAVLAGGEATLTSSTILSSLSILLGSLDTYNQLTFKDLNGLVVASYSGDQLYPPAAGDQFDEAANREFYFTFDASDKVTEVDFNSYDYSFEFDNVFASAVPEPGVWLMMIAGFGLVGGMMRRRPGVSAQTA